MKKVRFLCFILAICLLIGSTGCSLTTKRLVKRVKKADPTADVIATENAGDSTPGGDSQDGTAVPYYPQVTKMPGETVPPYNPQETQAPYFPQETQSPYYPQETDGPLNPKDTQNPYYPRETEPPYTQAPYFPQETQAPYFPQETPAPTSQTSKPTSSTGTSTPKTTAKPTATATPKPTATVKPTATPKITFDTGSNYIARDGVQINGVDQFTPGTGTDYCSVTAGGSVGKTFVMYGWYATQKAAITAFGYSVDDGPINYNSGFLSSVSDAARAHADNQVGKPNYTGYYYIKFNIADSKTHKYEVFAKVGSETIHVWTVYGVASGATAVPTPKPTPSPTPSTNYIPARIFTSQSSYDLTVGDSVTLKYAQVSSCSFSSTNSSVISVSSSGVATAVGKGKANVNMVASYGGTTYTFSVTFTVVAKPSTAPRGSNYFDASYQTKSYMSVGEIIKLNCSYINASGTRLTDISWRTTQPNIVSVDQNGNVKGLAVGEAIVFAKCVSAGKEFDFVVTVLPSNLSSAAKFVVNNHNSNIGVTYNLGIDGSYYYDVVNTANNYFAKSLQIDTRYASRLGSSTVGRKNDGIMSKCEYITVHYTGNMDSGADADNNADHFTGAMDYEASIHYVTGRTNLNGGYSKSQYYAFDCLNDSYQAWHAGSNGTLSDNTFRWIKTNVPVIDASKDAVISISKNSKFTINGFESNVSVPGEAVSSGTLYMTGPTYTYNGTTYDSINKNGIGWKAEGGYYYLASTYWHDWYYNLSNIGGNTASVGIESCVDKGSNLVHTWHVTAQLVAKLLMDKGLPTSRVVGHHFFSGKDCPQPLLEEDGYLWKNLFMKYVKAEYDYRKNYSGSTITYTVVNNGGGCLDDYGLVYQLADTHTITYKVTVKKGTTTETFNLSSIVESNKKRPSYSSGHESLQQLGYSIQ